MNQFLPKVVLHLSGSRALIHGVKNDHQPNGEDRQRKPSPITEYLPSLVQTFRGRENGKYESRHREDRSGKREERALDE